MNRILIILFLTGIIFVRYIVLISNINRALILRNPIYGHVTKIFSNKKLLIFNSSLGYILINNCPHVDMYDKVLVFDIYKTYRFWKQQGIYLQSNSCLKAVDKKYNLWYVLRYFYNLKRRLFNNFNLYTDKTISGLILAMLFGSVLFLEQNTYNMFKNLSLMHVLVVSGYNIQLVLDKLSNFLQYKVVFSIRKLIMAVVSLIFILGVGISPPVVRASVSSFLKNILDIIGIKFNQMIILILTVFVILLWNISWLFSLSFYLSILATIGVFLGGWLANKFQITQDFVKDIIITLCVTCITAPLLILKLHTHVSFKGIFANIILLPYIELVTYAGYMLLPFLLLHIGQKIYLFILSNMLNVLLFLMSLVISLF